MSTVVEVIHVMLAVALIFLVLIQKSEGGGLGMGGGGMSGFMTGRGQANLLTRTTSVLIALIMLTSITLVWLHRHERQTAPSLFETPVSTPAIPTTPAGPPATAPSGQSAPAPESAPAPAGPVPKSEAPKPPAPAVPLAR